MMVSYHDWPRIQLQIQLNVKNDGGILIKSDTKVTKVFCRRYYVIVNVITTQDIQDIFADMAISNEKAKKQVRMHYWKINNHKIELPR